MKMKKIQIYRPEFDVETNLFGKLSLIFCYFRFIKIAKLMICLDGAVNKSIIDKGYMICFPKFHFKRIGGNV